MQSFTHIENQVVCAVEGADSCFGNMGYKHVNGKNHGHIDEENYWKMLQVNAYRKALMRYLSEANCRCKPPKVINPSPAPCLNPQVNSVPLGIPSVDCFHCLTERQVLRMIEVLKIFCSTCNCN